jgi:cytochrome P450
VPKSDVEFVDGLLPDIKAYPRPGTLEEMRASHAKLTAFTEYVAELVAARRRMRGRLPVVSSLIDAVNAGEITHDELVANYISVLNAGTDSAMALITTGFLTLLRHPDQWGRLCENPKLAGKAVEECLRFESPIQGTARTACPGAVLEGRPIGPGCQVVGMIGSANRDPSIFAEADRFDLTRADGDRKLSFGPGVHSCLGQPLGRMEARVVFATLARTYRAVELVADGVTWRPSPFTRVPTSMPVVLGEAVRAPA